MHQHLALVKTLLPKVEREISVSDMDIILSQALLMDAGSATFKAIKSGEIADILAGLVALSHIALQALAMQDRDIVDREGESHQVYQMLAIMRQLSDQINCCSSAEAKHYSALYHLCASLVSGFLNADFDKAFQCYHQWYKVCKNPSGKASNQSKLMTLDLTDCLYE
jgi:hypothetical protein